MKYKRLIPLFSAVAIFILAEVFLAYPQFFYISLATALLVVFLSVKYLSSRSKPYWLFFTISPALFLTGFFFYSSVITGNIWIQTIFFIIAWFVFMYLRSFLYYSSNRDSQGVSWQSKLDNLMISGGFLTAFSTSAVLFDLSAFITWPFYLMLLLWAFIAWLLLVQFKPLKSQGTWPIGGLVLINVLVLTELAAVFSFLPLNFHILALFLAIIYYLSLMIVRLEFSSKLNHRALKLPLILSALAILLLLLTARWL